MTAADLAEPNQQKLEFLHKKVPGLRECVANYLYKRNPNFSNSHSISISATVW